MQLLETRFAARLRLGEDVIGELKRPSRAYPYREGLWELLITALYRAGRQADALAAYQRVRARLADELGLEPGPRLQELEQQILLHDSGARAPRRPGTCRRCRPSSSARDAEIAALCDLLARAPAGRDRRARRDRQDGPRDRDRPRAGRRSRVWLARLEARARPPTTSSTR